MKDDYVAYEYISINVKSDLEPMYIDTYENFGWILINNGKRDYYINSNPNFDVVNIKFKRNKNIKNKEKLQELQQKCENAFLTVDKLEKNSQSIGTIYAFLVAFIATIFITISVFSVVGEKIIWFPAIVCGIIGIIGWILPYFTYKNIKIKKELENKPKIDEQQNIIDDVCRQARKLLLEDE